MTNQQLHQRRSQVIAQGMGALYPLYVEKAENAHVWDVDGNKYIDFAAGIAVTNTGHANKRINEAVKAQLDNFSHTCAMVTPYVSFVELAEKLTELAPGDSDKKAIFLTTGAEAVENAVKVARAHTGRSGVIAFKGGFHGRTNMTMGLTGKVAPYKAGFGPFPNEIFHAPYPNAFHGVSTEQSLQALDDLFACDIEPSRVAAIIFEPVQGEGGFYQAPAEFAQGLRELCDKHGIMLIADEIQTGFARTGKMFATEYLGIEPDMITMAKGIAGGFPISAVVGKSDVMDSALPGGLGGTYAGSPLGCVAGLEVLKIIEEEQLCAKAMGIGEVVNARMSKLQESVPAIGEIRTTGAMMAIEFTDPESGKPLQDLTKAVIAKAQENGLILLSCGVKANVIRLLPPLTIESEVLSEGLDKLEKIILEVA
ncbi:4-aminobutyrate aminotransferase PuuE [Vibrio crassostreae]|uniref:4-aminobutyrate--2-oxoglutarate transaminase n=1 Tax=Vibrio crassostreae TaxID=246167 RepID=UPI000F4737E5|nr:4-aminobutyrate--2-oxoglutarate transaminase [Vibrio crassostreae]ROO63848.1 4-aminobutyrate aminotransferase [Vibrio crassostreae]CAK1855660.1 4-aminobutyrate aminotransferase PuuE [Vibrio crassostreae]CAK1992341.1 4-aminobutyrate aminotransferase PuuE [Vibrio crassostreae]CAK2725285.1 4-aminobutyrate aminotransferase PuuE [Vibrio crassostreae]CAK3316928.1 4-aminobutyrate aminotransferase PuuE [Vibrio crassostreae]